MPARLPLATCTPPASLHRLPPCTISSSASPVSQVIRAVALFEEIDADHDGAISQAELQVAGL